MHVYKADSTLFSRTHLSTFLFQILLKVLDQNPYRLPGMVVFVLIHMKNNTQPPCITESSYVIQYKVGGKVGRGGIGKKKEGKSERRRKTEEEHRDRSTFPRGHFHTFPLL